MHHPTGPADRGVPFVPIASGPGRAEEDLQGPELEEFGSFLDDYFGDFFKIGGRQDLGGGFSWPDISLGFPTILEVFGAGIGIPPVVQPPPFVTPDPIFKTPDYNPSATMNPTTWQEWQILHGSLPDGWNKFPTPVEYMAGGGVSTVVSAPVTANQPEAPMELGANLLDLGGALLGQYIAGKFGVGGLPAALAQPINYTSPAPGVVGIDTSALYANGKLRVPCKRRRRRKRLATASDIRDLASLEGVLGKGTLMKTWIATHPS